MGRDLKKRALGKRNLGDLVAGVMDARNLGPELDELRTLMAWDGAVGERIARRARPGRLEGGVLHVRVTSSPWLAELSFHREEMRTRVNAAVGAEVVREVRLHAGALPSPTQAEPGVGVPAPVPRRRPRQPLAATLTPEVSARIDQELAAIDDPDLREALARVRRKLGA